MENPTQPRSHTDVPCVELYIARETGGIDRTRGRDHRLRRRCRAFAELKAALVALTCGRVVRSGQLGDIARASLSRDGPVIDTHAVPGVRHGRGGGHGFIEDGVRCL